MDRQTKLDVLYNWLSRKECNNPMCTKILHPPILSDVLVWLENNRIEVDIDWKWLLEIYSGFDNAFDRDLTKPYLSEQNDEVINGLYEVYLLNNKL